MGLLGVSQSYFVSPLTIAGCLWPCTYQGSRVSQEDPCLGKQVAQAFPAALLRSAGGEGGPPGVSFLKSEEPLGLWLFPLHQSSAASCTPLPSCIRVPGGWRVGARLWPQHSWNAAAAADWTPGLPPGTSPASQSQAWGGLGIGEAVLGTWAGGSALKLCRLCACSHGCQSYVHVRLTPRGEQVCGCMHFFLRLHMGLLLCLFRSVPHPLLHVLVCPQMPVLQVLVL